MASDSEHTAGVKRRQRRRNTSPTARGDSVSSCIAGMRSMILNRSLLPGEQIRQAEMAERLGVSRVPLREALKVLETEGVLDHTPNQGYFVAKLRNFELSQIYRMRQLLEGELLASLEWPDDAFLAKLVEANEEMRQVASNPDAFERLVAANRTFHFLIFGLSPQSLMLKEVERLWALSEPYRAVYLYEPGARERVLSEHVALIDALAERDERQLIDISDHHRRGLQTHMARLLEPGPQVQARSERPSDSPNDVATAKVPKGRRT